MSIGIFDVDGPLNAADPTRCFFDWAVMQPDVTTNWSYECYVRTGNWRRSTGGVSRAQIGVLFQHFCETDFYPDMQGTPGAYCALQNLPEMKKYVATARPEAQRAATVSFLMGSIGVFEEYHFEAHEKQKATLARKLGAHYFIDDNPGVLCEVAKSSRAWPILFPIRTKRDLTELEAEEKVIVLGAESYVRDDMSLEDFSSVCILAWEEIVRLVQNGLCKR